MASTVTRTNIDIDDELLERDTGSPHDAWLSEALRIERPLAWTERCSHETGTSATWPRSRTWNSSSRDAGALID